MKTAILALGAALALGPAAAQAGPLLRLEAGVVKVAVIRADVGFGGQDWKKHRHDGDNGGDNNNNNDGNRWGGNNGNNGGGRHNDDNDNGGGMDRAYALAASRGRVIDVWPEGGSRFGATVSNDRGKVTLEIDVRSGSVRER